MVSPLALALAAQVAAVPLQPGEGVPEIARSVYVLVDESRELGIQDVVAMPDAFRRNAHGFVNPGTTAGVVWIRIDVSNVGATPGTWVLSLDRFLVDPGAIYQVDAGGIQTLLESTPQAFARSYADFGTLAASFELEGGGDAQLYVRYRGGNWSGLDPTLTTAAALDRKTTRQLLMFFLLLGGIGSLVIYGSVSFLFLGRQIVLLYALAQVALFTFYAHMGGFTTVYLWPSSPQSGRVVAPLAMAVFVVSMVQFARRFFATPTATPRLDRVLSVYVALGGLAAILIPLDYLVPAFDARLPLYLLYLTTTAVWLTLPPLAVLATVRWHRDFWPLAVAWSLMASFMLSLQLIWTGILQVMPLGKNAYGAVAYAEALFLALAIALRIRVLRRQREEAERRLRQSLGSELASAQRAMQLTQEREWALSDLADMGRMVLAAGHDSRQMLSALRHYSHGLQRLPSGPRVEDAGRRILEIADSLDEVLNTTIVGSSSGGMGDSLLALEVLVPAQILNVLRLVHGATAVEKGVDLRLRMSDRPLVTDRVLMARAVGNLVSNALKHTDPGGTVLVTCRNRADGHRFQVFDTGDGIGAEELVRLLDPSTGALQLAGSEDGHGAGLHIVKVLARRLGARLEARSEPGRGSAFELVLPVPRPTLPPLGMTRLVLADTDAEHQQLLRRALSAFDVELVPTEHPDQVLDHAAGAGHVLVVADLHFAGTQGGIALCEEVRARCPAAVTVLSTFDRSIEVRRRAASVCSLLAYQPWSADLVVAVLEHSLASTKKLDEIGGRVESGIADATKRGAEV